MLWWRILDFWDCIWYYSRGKIRYRVFYYGDDTYRAFASNGYTTVCDCYGSTPEAAKEMALVKLKLAIAKYSELKAPLD